MAAPTNILTLEVATPIGLALKTEAESVQAPSVQGEFGVLADHLPLLASLKSGLLRYKAEGKEFVVAIGPGFVEVEPDRVQVLTDLFVKPEDVDVDRVNKELTEAHAKLKLSSDEIEQLELQRDIDWAQAQLDARAQVS